MRIAGYHCATRWLRCCLRRYDNPGFQRHAPGHARDRRRRTALTGRWWSIQRWFSTVDDDHLTCAEYARVAVKLQAGAKASHAVETLEFNNMMYTLLSLAGNDRASFLQGQMTQDIGRLQGGLSRPSAWCNPKGRVLLTCELLACRDRIVMAVPSASADIAQQRLGMYRLRADVAIGPETELCRLAFNGDAAGRLAAGRNDPEDAEAFLAGSAAVTRLSADTVEVIASPTALAELGVDVQQALGDADWAARRVAAGRPDIDTANAERFTPHMLNLDLLGAISFDKGCYTGQEVVARTENLGTVKRRLTRYRLQSGDAVPGSKLRAAESDVGEVVNVAGREVLAVVRREHADRELLIDGGSVEPLPLPYATAPTD